MLFICLYGSYYIFRSSSHYSLTTAYFVSHFVFIKRARERWVWDRERPSSRDSNYCNNDFCTKLLIAAVTCKPHYVMALVITAAY